MAVKPFRIIASATATIWVYHAVAAISGLVALPLIVAHLDQTQFGIWILVVQAITFLRMGDLGVANALGRFVSRCRGADDRLALEKTYSTAAAMLVGAGVVASLLVLGLSPWVPHVLGVEGAYHSQASLAFAILGLSLAIDFPLAIGVGILSGHQLYGPHATGKILGALLRLAGTFALAYQGALELVPLSVIYAISAVVGNSVLVVVAWRMTRPWRLSFSKISLPVAKEIFDLGGSSLLTTLSNVIYRSGLPIAIGLFLGVKAAAVYGIPLILMQHITPLVISLSTSFSTLASELQAKDKIAKLRQTSTVIMRITFALSTCMAAGLFIYGEPILRLLFAGSQFTSVEFHQAGVLLCIMGFGAALGLPQHISMKTLQGVGKHWLVTRASLVSSVVAFIVGLIGIFAGLGVYGAALGWSFFWVLQGVLFYPSPMCKVLGQTIGQMLMKSYLPGAIVGLCVLGLAWTTSRWLVPTTLPHLVAGIVLCATLGCTHILIISGRGSAVVHKLTGWR